VSECSRRELVALGAAPEDVHVVYSGNDVPDDLASYGGVERTAAPSLVVLGRLVPHKRIELALEVVARLRPRFPGLRLTVLGQGYWADALAERARQLGVADAVDLAGYVPDRDKHEILASSWVHLLPSVKEGWGLAVIESAMHGTPSVAFRSAGGTSESVLHASTGLLVDDQEQFVAATALLLADAQLRSEMGCAARRHAARFTWDATCRDFAAVLHDVLPPELVSRVDAAPPRRVPAQRDRPAAPSRGVVLHQRLVDGRAAAAGPRRDQPEGQSDGDDRTDHGGHHDGDDTSRRASLDGHLSPRLLAPRSSTVDPATARRTGSKDTGGADRRGGDGGHG
jgi:hypothetical protein